MPLTDEQRNATTQMRAYITGAPFPAGTAESVDQRARRPDPAHVPADVEVRVEIAPPSPHPFPLLDSSALKTPERVPVYFCTLRSEQAGSDTTDMRVIFFIHGGGNVADHPADEPYIHLYAHILRAIATHSGGANRCVLIAPSYRLATIPENTFPAALQDVVAAYDYVLSKGYNASNIVVAGASAGGNHGLSACSFICTRHRHHLTALVLTHLILQSGRPTPRGVITFAPAAIQAYDQLSERAKANADADVVTVHVSEQCSSSYVGDTGVARMDPLVSGVFIPFTTSWPKTLILIGSGDILIDASRELEKRLSTLNLQVELVEYEERPHMWFLMRVFSEDIQDAAARIARFAFGSSLA